MSLRITDHGEDHAITLEQLAAAIGGGGGGSARVAITMSYYTLTAPLAVYFTCLLTNGSVLVPRDTVAAPGTGGLYSISVNPAAHTDLIAVWDEGDVDDFVTEWIVVDT